MYKIISHYAHIHRDSYLTYEVSEIHSNHRHKHNYFFPIGSYRLFWLSISTVPDDHSKKPGEKQSHIRPNSMLNSTPLAITERCRKLSERFLAILW